jgi:glycosyltransferase involved in cell wall biosynthesis
VPDTVLRIVGDGNRRAFLAELAADLGVSNAVEFVGWVEPKTIPAHVAAADVGVVPHRSNEHTETTVPHKLFHYMAGSIPSLVTDVAPLERIVTETDSGRVAAPTPESLATHATALLEDNHTAAQLGANGRDAVETSYGWQQDATRLISVYESL